MAVFESGTTWVFCAAALAALVLLRSSAGGWLRAGAWFALAIAGQVASLGLYEAGPHVGYHHYRPHADSALSAGVLALVLVAQSALVATGLRARWSELRAGLGRHLTVGRAALVLGAMLLAATKPTTPASRSALEFLFAWTVQLVALGNLVVAVLALPRATLDALDAWLDRRLGARGGEGPEPGPLDGFAWSLAAGSALVAALLCVFVYERHPHVPDEVVYLLHARYLAAGELWLAPPPVPAGFDVDLMLLDGGKWYSPVPIGWPVVLALGARFGVPWLVNPLLGGATVLATYLFARELANRRDARVVALLLAASPWFVFLNMSFMPHAATLGFAVVAALGVARSRRSGSIPWALVAGACTGMVALIRPLEGAVLALALGLWSIGLGGARLRVGALAALVLATATVTAATVPYNRALTGAAFDFPIQHYVDVVYGHGKNDMGFGADKGLGWSGLDPWLGHSPLEAAVTSQFNVFAIQAELCGWSTGSLLFVLLFFAVAKTTRTDRALLAFALAIPCAGACYWFNGGPDFGARYWYLVCVPLAWLTMRGLREVGARAEVPARVAAFACALIVLAWCTWVPWRADDKYADYRGMNAAVRRLLARRDLGRALVLVYGLRHPDFASAAVYNPLDLEADAPIFAWAPDRVTRSALLEHYADRPVWLLAARGAGELGYELEGPLPAASVSRDELAALTPDLLPREAVR